MAFGLITSQLANPWLNILRGTAMTPPTALYMKLHVGDPGAAGTANPSAVTTRPAVTYAAAAGGAIAITGTAPSWSMTATETIQGVSFWDSATAGNCWWTAPAAINRSVVSGDTITLKSANLSVGPLAA